ncbi:MAG TPA: DUF805 domain-containing protein, partial [Candidatus Dormibacteraeota bacterium]|nr:DUF805 domain-containing protein [Candidatus Dormibacteraeota bacterium]
MKISDLWCWEGRVSRGEYAAVGFIGVAIKHYLDRMIAIGFFGYRGQIFNYWAPLGKAARLDHLSSVEAKFLMTLLVVSIPFIGVGVAMTVKRLRDAGQPVWLVVLFLFPFVNALFLLLLCVLPPRESSQELEGAPWPGPHGLDRFIPRTQTGSAALAIAVTAVLGLGFVLLGTIVIGAYGWSLFVALPFCLGMFSVLLYSYHEPRDWWQCLGVALLPVGLVGAALIVVAVEGIICVLMAAPFALVLAALGGSLGYVIQAHHWRSQTPAMFSLLILLVPASFGVEHAAALRPPVYEVRTAIEVNAPPEKVWRQVVTFAEIPPPKELLFRAGIAYPIRAKISGHGVGAVRHCIFSTGPFVEPIEVWDEPRLLRFGVTANPAPLNELTPYGHIDAPHLHGYFESEKGQLLLTALPGGRTRLEGTTWYHDAIWPAAYWHLWSDHIIHKIHFRVLEHI